MSAARARKAGLSSQSRWENAILEKCERCGTYGTPPCDCMAQNVPRQLATAVDNEMESERPNQLKRGERE